LIGAEKNTGYGNVQSLRKDKRAVSPAISTVILTAAVVVMILVAMGFANNFLNARMAENEFSTNKQFMLTTGLQIDDIAWTIGRTQTVRYSSKFGNMKYQSAALNYTFEVKSGAAPWVTAVTNVTGMIMFNIPVSTYSISNNYFERILPSSNGSFLQTGPSAPVSNVFCVEKLPMSEGNYTRIVVVPTVRMLNATIAGPQQNATNYYKFYLPTLVPSSTNPHLSQSITMTGSDIVKVTASNVDQVRITVTFPNEGSPGFTSDFFKFDSTTITLSSSTVPKINAGSVVEFYIGKVVVSLGQV
jgi:hypothetical protein